ncbi:MAG: hypothetical protein COX57_02705 [Alphaproteobacteria bacterium CG_4_10_14_0_2_um_filter_63_37]|nr:MAG: hypothetical protein AUJ55_10320 [Proteobacteria bacterium CG1_02_64_396]PJA25587.1 MAG: hypothetical protein COX57_02705 [Alphaproteobacteria bacterium CG_4_10_14_0_2_um_filter_63_37]
MNGRRHRGFTLLELVATMAIISLTIGLFTATLVGDPNAALLDDESDRLAKTIRAMADETAVTAQAVRLEFDLEKGSYRWLQLPQNLGGSSDGKPPEGILMRERPFAPHTLPPQVKLGAAVGLDGSPVFLILPTGVIPAGKVVLVAGDQQRVLTIAPGIDPVRIESQGRAP